MINTLKDYIPIRSKFLYNDYFYIHTTLKYCGCVRGINQESMVVKQAVQNVHP